MTDAERIAELQERRDNAVSWESTDYILTEALATLREQAAQIEALTAENGELQEAREHGWQDRALTSEAERDQLKAQVQALQQVRDELLVAVKGYRKVVRPWMDAAIGRPGTVSYAEWETAVDRLEAAINPPRCIHEWGINGCKKCGQPAMPRG